MTRHEATRAMFVVSAIVLAACDTATPGRPSPTSPPTATPPATATFMVSGSVFDSVSRALAGARVEVLGGARAGSFLVTDDHGQFAFDQPLDQYVQVRASLPGYVDDVRVVGTAGATGSTHQMAFSLRSPNASVDLTGHHRITFTADAACADLPPVARERTYLANVTGQAALYGAKFGGEPGNNYLWNTLYLSQFEDYAVFHLDDPPVWELLPGDGYVVIYGGAKGQVGPSGGTLPLWGWFAYCPRMKAGQYPACADAEATCQSSQHQMTIVRR